MITPLRSFILTASVALTLPATSSAQIRRYPLESDCRSLSEPDRQRALGRRSEMIAGEIMGSAAAVAGSDCPCRIRSSTARPAACAA
jgi:hypothetical protein